MLELGAGLILGLSVSVAGMAVLLKALEECGSLATPNARIATSWCFLPALAGRMAGHIPDAGHAPGVSGGLAITIAVTLGKVFVFVVLSLKIGSRALPWLLRRGACTGSQELVTLEAVS